MPMLLPMLPPPPSLPDVPPSPRPIQPSVCLCCCATPAHSHACHAPIALQHRPCCLLCYPNAAPTTRCPTKSTLTSFDSSSSECCQPWQRGRRARRQVAPQRRHRRQRRRPASRSEAAGCAACKSLECTLKLQMMLDVGVSCDPIHSVKPCAVQLGSDGLQQPLQSNSALLDVQKQLHSLSQMADSHIKSITKHHGCYTGSQSFMRAGAVRCPAWQWSCAGQMRPSAGAGSQRRRRLQAHAAGGRDPVQIRPQGKKRPGSASGPARVKCVDAQLP